MQMAREVQPAREEDRTLDIPPLRLRRSRSLVLGAAFLGLLCAGAAFFLLVVRDHGKAQVMVHDQSAAPAVRHAVASGKTAPPAAIAGPEKKSDVAQSDPVRTPFRLERSSKASALGPIRLRLTRTDTKKGLYDISVVAGRRSFSHRRLRLNAPVWIDLGRGKGALQIVATAVEKRAIEGYWTQSEHAPEVSTARRKR